MRRYGRRVRWAAEGSVTVGAETVTRAEFLDRVARAAEGCRGAPSVAVVARSTLDTAVAIVAAIDAGVPVIPIGADAGPVERAHLLTDSGAAMLVDGSEWRDLRPATAVGLGDAVLVLYTSGTTGPPKGVPVTATAVRTCIDGLAAAWAWSPDDVLVHGLPLHHVHGLVLGVLGPLLIGSDLRHTGRPTPDRYAAARGSLYFGVPTVWSRIAREPSAARALAGARLLVSGSAALPAPVFDSIAALADQSPIERYGMTETLITLSARADEARLRGVVGRPLPGVLTRLVDEDGGPAPAGELGHLQVHGPTVCAGYLGRPADTAAAVTDDGWFRTGDVATVDSDGRHRIVGRASTDLIKTGGYRVGAGEVEDALLLHPSVHEAAVRGEPDADLGERLVAFVVADGIDEQILIAHVATCLSEHKRPRRVVFVDALPRNAMGKVDKTRL